MQPVLKRAGAARPKAQAVDPEQLIGPLRRRSRQRWAKTFFSIVFGLATTLIAPAFAALACFALDRSRREADAFGWWTWFGGACAIVIPILFWWDRRTHPESLMAKLRAEGGRWTGVGRWSSQEEFDDATNIVEYMLLTEILLFGPRLVTNALRDLVERFRLRGVAMRQAAEVLGTLLSHERGMEFNELVNGMGVDGAEAFDAVLYLVFHEWVDVSKDLRRVWPLSATRELLS